jgi:hypothetical protein
VFSAVSIFSANHNIRTESSNCFPYGKTPSVTEIPDAEDFYIIYCLPEDFELMGSFGDSGQLVTVMHDGMWRV